MNTVQFHVMRQALLDNASPSRHSDLATVESSLRGLLLESGLFDLVEVERTDDPDRLVIGLCMFKQQFSAVDIARYLTRAWTGRVAYPFWEAHTVQVDRDFVELEAATRQGSGGRFVTVHLIAQKAMIPAQRTASV